MSGRHLVRTAALAAACLAAALPAGAITVFGGDAGRVIGSGHLVAVPRQPGAFTGLRIDAPVDIVARPGTHPGVVVHADDNIAPLVETVVEGDTLVVRLRPGVSFVSEHDLALEVEFATLASTRQDGSGTLHITALAGPRLDARLAGSCDLVIDDAQLGSLGVDVAGSGDVRVKGRADAAKFHVAGSGDIHAAALAARRVEVDVQGSGDADVNATETLSARVAGSGDVRYRGHPQDVSRKVAGSGTVQAED